MATERRIDRVRRMIEGRQQGAVILEDCQDPWNAAAVYRTCEGLGIHELHLVFERVPPFDPFDNRATPSTAAQHWLDIRVHDSTDACVDQLVERGHQIVCATSDPRDSESIFDAELATPRIALLFGNERNGLSDRALARADRRLHLPMAGMTTSLNLSVTVALCLFALVQQRQRSGLAPFLLPEAERAALRARYLDPLLTDDAPG